MDQKKNSFDFFSNFSSWLIAALFILLYFILSFHSRIAGDDYYYLWLENSFGAWGGMINQYNAWSGRWFAHLIGCAMISAWENPFFLPFINLVTIVLLFISIEQLFRKIIVAMGIFVNRKTAWPLIIIIICASFFLSYDIGETWFWYIIILTYLWSIIGFLFLLNCIFSVRDSIFNFLLIVFFSSYIGGASESYAILFAGGLLILLYFNRKNKNKKSINDPKIKIIFALAILSISFSFSALAPGTEIRHSLLPHTTFISKIWISLKAFLKYFIRFLPQKIFFIVLFSTPWLNFGFNYLKNKYSPFESKKLILKSIIIFLVFLAVMFIPTAFIMSETGPARALSVISFLTAIFFAIVFALAGVLIDFNKAVVKTIFSFVMITSISLLIYNIYFQYVNSKTFAEACDERLKIIRDAKENNFNGVLELKKIPPAGMLYWDELSIDTSYYVNRHLKDGLGLPFSIRLKSE